MRPEFTRLQIPLPIAIIGLGLSGQSAKKLLLALGVEENQILTLDHQSPADFQDPQDLMAQRQPRSLCVSPGVHLKQAWIQKALSEGVRLTSELEIAFECLTSEQVIAVTGAVGKSTTTSILGAGAKQMDPMAFVGGNLGTPLADYVTDVITNKRSRAQWMILELSSYQLENFANLRARVSLLTHLSPNHLERYENLSHYYQTKLEIFKHTAEFGVLNRSGGHIASWIDQIQKSNPKLKWTWTDRNDPVFKNRLTTKPALVGSHNLDNLSLAFATADFLKWSAQAYQAMLAFPGLAHRLENCGRHENILFLNDSKSTTIESVLQALQSVRHEFPQEKIHLLLGGKDKNLPWQNLKILKSHSHLAIHFFGKVGPIAKSRSELTGSLHETFKACLQNLTAEIHSGEIVLLSPGGTSWDEFKNFEERGSYFKNWISMEFQDSQP